MVENEQIKFKSMSPPKNQRGFKTTPSFIKPQRTSIKKRLLKMSIFSKIKNIISDDHDFNADDVSDKELMEDLSPLAKKVMEKSGKRY
jgi:hypothetical protein